MMVEHGRSRRWPINFVAALLICVWAGPVAAQALPIEEHRTVRENSERADEESTQESQKERVKATKSQSRSWEVTELRDVDEEISDSQILAGAATGYGIGVVGTGLLISALATGDQAVGEEQQAMALGGAALLVLGPMVVAPTTVNIMGNRHYENQYLGAYLGGALAGLATLGGIATLLALGPEDSDSEADLALMVLGYPLLVTMGATAGYEHQRSLQQLMNAEVGPVPMIDRQTRKIRLGVGISGRF